MRDITQPVKLSITVLAASFALLAQTTDGVVSGRLRDSITGRRIPAASLVCESEETDTRVFTRTGDRGTFGLPMMPPGRYRVRVDAASYQSVDIEQLILPVAGMLYLDLRLRPLSDVWERNEHRSVFLPSSRLVLVFYGPDVDTSRSTAFSPPSTSTTRLDTSISDVISPELIRELPLQGRDVYSAIVMEPGVTSDMATSRGIGVAVNGQRPSSANFLLDGSENNRSLLSGPLLIVPPEAVQEFRFSTSNYSAEYGRTSGFIVNAATRSGSAAWHGIAYQDFNSSELNANDFQRNAAALGRLRFRHENFGVQAGGRVRKFLFSATSLDFLGSDGDRQPQTRLFPSAAFIAQAARDHPGSFGVRLLQTFTPVHRDGVPAGPYTIARVTPTSTLRRYLGMQRIDVRPSRSGYHIALRMAGSWLSRPDFYWSPYPGFSTELLDRTVGLNAAIRAALSPNVTSEFRISRTHNRLGFPRPHPEVPNLATQDCAQLPQGNGICGGLSLPQAGILYGYIDRLRTYELAKALSWIRGRHIFKVGADVLFRGIGGYLALGGEGALTFTNLSDFVEDKPFLVELGIDRLAYNLGRFQPVDYNRDYRNRQAAFFAQDSIRLTSRLSVNFGMRYDRFGAPIDIGRTNNTVVQLGAGSTLAAAIAGAALAAGARRQRVFSSDPNDWAGRFGISYAGGSDAKTVLRGGYGVFYDRPFDNLWGSLALNNVLLQPGYVDDGDFSYSRPLLDSLRTAERAGSILNRLLLYQPGLRTPYIHSAFAGLQRQLSPGTVLEVNYSGRFGHKLITTDRINRGSEASGALNDRLPEIVYRANQGASAYNALTMKLTGSLRQAVFRFAYTWSHSIDNQSEPLAGEFSDLSAANPSSSGRPTGVAAFSRQFASGLDRGSSDFDQRHNLVGMGFWRLPGILNGWRVAGLGAIRSGLPFTVYAQQGLPIYNARASLADPARWSADEAVERGRRILNAAAFRLPPNGEQGSTGRNGFPGPGFYSVDASVSRSFRLKGFAENQRLILRLDIFNLLNHANLGNPAVALGSEGRNQSFGVAYYGRARTDDRSPVLTPLEETPRQVHFLVRFEF